MNQILPSGQIVILVHLTYRVPDDFEENKEDGTPWRIACMPNMREFHSTPYHPNYQRSDNPRAVTCPACKDTIKYKQLVGL